MFSLGMLIPERLASDEYDDSCADNELSCLVGARIVVMV